MYIATLVEEGKYFYRKKIDDKDEFYWVRERNLAYGYSTPVEAIIAAIESLPEHMKHNVGFEPM